LFIKDPEKRLGSLGRDAEEIKEHPWFNVINWTALFNKEIKAPKKPVISSPGDVKNFDPVIFNRNLQPSLLLILLQMIIQL